MKCASHTSAIIAALRLVGFQHRVTMIPMPYSTHFVYRMYFVGKSNRVYYAVPGGGSIRNVMNNSLD